jgi:hypothetical protein
MKASKLQIVIRIPSGRVVTIGQWVHAFKTLKTADPKATVPNWSWCHNDAAHVLREMRHSLDDMIERHDRTRPAHWRKLDPDWQRMMQRTAREVNTPRLVVRWLPLELRGKLAHRLFKDD